MQFLEQVLSGVGGHHSDSTTTVVLCCPHLPLSLQVSDSFIDVTPTMQSQSIQAIFSSTIAAAFSRRAADHVSNILVSASAH